MTEPPPSIRGSATSNAPSQESGVYRKAPILSGFTTMLTKLTTSRLEGFLHCLPPGKQHAALCIACVGMLQICVLLTTLAKLAVHGAAGFTSSNAIGILVLLLLSTVLELVGVVYILLPASDHAHHADENHSMRSWASSQHNQSTGFSSQRSLEPRQLSSTLGRNKSFTEAALQRSNTCNRLKTRCDTAPGSLPEVRSSITGGTSPLSSTEWSELAWRMDALANLKGFMQGLDRQASAELFVHGAANAIQSIFPGVNHASFCLLNSNRTSVNVYTFLGEGAQTVPYTSVAVAPGTLIYYVIQTCQPVFISNIAAFQRPYSDLQFMHYVMGLHSMTCLPLVIAHQQVLGALRLGFEEPRAWEDTEKRLAEELALILSSSSAGLGAASPSFSTNTSHSLLSQWASSRRSSLIDVSGALHAAGDPSQQPFNMANPAAHPQLLSMQQEPPLYYSVSSPNDSSSYAGLHSGGDSGHLPDIGPICWDHAEQLHHTASSDHLETRAAMAAAEQQDYDLKKLEIIGRGAFGSVFRGTWRGEQVAVKVVEHGDDLQGCCDVQGPSASAESASARRAALLEGAMTRTLKHPNVVQTYDYRVVNLNPRATQGLSLNRTPQETQIIMEFCDQGSLQDAIGRGAFSSTADGSAGVDMQHMTMTLAEIALAMTYLHAHRITHRDLKPKNILLKSSNKDSRGFRSLVSDFGLSQVLPDNDNSMRSLTHAGTVTHMPPELIEDGKVYQQGDAFAFGILMWELFTAAAPYTSMTQVQIMVAVVTHDMRPKFPDNCPEWYKSLANKCWRKDPMSRPSFQEIANFLMTMISDKSWPAMGEGSEDAHPREVHG